MIHSWEPSLLLYKHKFLMVWHLFIWKLDMLHRESKKLLLNDSDQSIIAWAAPPFMCSSGGIMSHCALPDVLTSKSGGHVSEQFWYSGLSIFYICWFIFSYWDKQNNVSITFEDIWDLAKFVYPCQPPHFIFHFERI